MVNTVANHQETPHWTPTSASIVNVIGILFLMCVTGCLGIPSTNKERSFCKLICINNNNNNDLHLYCAVCMNI